MANKEAVAKYSKTKKGVSSAMYQAQKINSKKRGHPPPDYCLNEFRKWLFCQQNFESLYKNWLNGGCVKLEKPSVDRIDDYKPYSIDNIRLTTWRDNKYRYFKDLISGVNTKKARAIQQFDLNGNLISYYYSMAEAMRVTGIHETTIRSSMTTKKGNTKGFKFKYVTT